MKPSSIAGLSKRPLTIKWALHWFPPLQFVFLYCHFVELLPVGDCWLIRLILWWSGLLFSMIWSLYHHFQCNGGNLVMTWSSMYIILCTTTTSTFLSTSDFCTRLRCAADIGLDFVTAITYYLRFFLLRTHRMFRLLLEANVIDLILFVFSAYFFSFYVTFFFEILLRP